MTEQSQSVVVRDEPQLSRPRLPYPARVEEIFSVSRASWRFLTDVLYPNAEEPETIINVLAYCQARKLDVMKKPVHVVPVWDRKRKKMVDSVWPSIAEVRITAMRTGEYVGKGETIFGPEVTETLGGVEITYPKFAQLTVYRLVAGVAREFHGEKLLWKEFYAKAGRDTLAPNDMWKTKPFKQLAKCAEADALRAAFPEETGSDPTAEEMHGQEVDVTIAERVSGPNLQSRLSKGASGSQGLDAAGLASIDERPEPSAQKGGSVQEPAIDAEIAEIQPIARAEAPPVSPDKPKRGRKSNAEKAEIAAREAAEAAATSQVPSEPVQAATELQSEPEEASEAEFTPVDASDPNVWMVLAEIDGPAPHGEEYTLLEDEPINGRLPVYLDGAKIGEIGPEDSGSYNAYDHHPESVEEFPGDKPAPVIGETVAANTGPVLTGAFKTFWANFIETEASSWQPIKDALRQLQATQDFKDLTPAEQNAWRRLVGQAIAAAKIEAAEFEIDPLDDITAFRLALETWDEAEFVVEMWSALQETALYKGLAENLQAALSKAVAERISALETA